MCRKLLHHRLGRDEELFLQAIAPYRKDLVVRVECLFCWYWLADLCTREGLAFVLGHALYMKAPHARPLELGRRAGLGGGGGEGGGRGEAS